MHVLVDRAHVLYHPAISVLLVRTDQRADTLRICIRIRLNVADLRQIVLRAGHLIHWINELWWTEYPLLHAARLTVIGGKPLVLRWHGALRLVIEAADLFLFLVVDVLVR